MSTSSEKCTPVHQDDKAYMTDLQKESYRPFHTFPQKSYQPFHPFHFTDVFRQGRAEDAKAVLQRLRGPGYDIEPEVRREKNGSGCFKFWSRVIVTIDHKDIPLYFVVLSELHLTDQRNGDSGQED